MAGRRRYALLTTAAALIGGATLLAATPALATSPRPLPDAGRHRGPVALPHAAPVRGLATALSASGSGSHGALPAVVRPKPISRDANPQVTDAAGTSQADTQTEPSIAADPRGGRHLVMVTQQGRFDNGGSSAPGYAHSGDGGRTWRSANLPGLTTASGGPFSRGSDTVAVYGPDGTAYAETLVFNVDDCHNGIAVQRSRNGGATFGPAVMVAETSDCQVEYDKEWIVVDTNRRSPHFGRIYTVWDEYQFDADFNLVAVPEVLRYSDDRGATWSDRVLVNNSFNAYPVPLVAPDGTVVVAHMTYDPTDTFVTGIASNRSTDGGRTFGPDVTATGFVQDSGPADLRYGGVPNAGVDPTTGRMFIVWDDSRFNPNGRDDVLMVASRDSGRTWGAPTDVTPSAPGDQTDHLTPMVAADHGRVYVSYLGRDESTPTTAQRTRTFITRSRDGGRTFGASYGLGPSSDLAYAPVAPVPFPGDYTGLVTANNKVYAAWAVSSAPPPTSTSATHQVTWGAVLDQW